MVCGTLLAAPQSVPPELSPKRGLPLCMQGWRDIPEVVAHLTKVREAEAAEE